MRITIVQNDILWGDVKSNIVQAQRLIEQASDSRLYILPEMWATGFNTSDDKMIFAEDEHPALTWMHKMADTRQCAICGSLAVRLPDNTCRNRNYFVTPNQTSHIYYDKHHLFSYGHEDQFYTPGQEPVVVEWEGVRFLLLTCYDLRFPVWSRYGFAGKYDAIIVVANWPMSRQRAWEILTRARAVENQCYLLGANRVGSDPVTNYKGESCVIDPSGTAIALAYEYTIMTITAELDMTSLREVRNRFRVLDDMDTCLISTNTR